MPAYYGGKGAAGEAGTENYSVEQLLQNQQTAIDQTRADRMAMVALAKQYGLPGGFCAYESGPDIGGGSRVNIANRIRAIRARASGSCTGGISRIASGIWAATWRCSSRWRAPTAGMAPGG